MLLQVKGGRTLRDVWDRLENLTRDVHSFVHLMSEQSHLKAFIGQQGNKDKAASMTLQLTQLQEKLKLALGLETYKVRHNHKLVILLPCRNILLHMLHIQYNYMLYYYYYSPEAGGLKEWYLMGGMVTLAGRR